MISCRLETMWSSRVWPCPAATTRMSAITAKLPMMSTWSPVLGPPWNDSAVGLCSRSRVTHLMPAPLPTHGVSAVETGMAGGHLGGGECPRTA
jgi:hypothetical protein